MPKHNLHNPTSAPRVVYDAKVSPVTILPGQTVYGVELNQADIDDLKKRTLKDPKADLVLSDHTEGESEHDEPPLPPSEDWQPPTADQLNALVEAADVDEFNEWKAKVRTAIGEDWPGGKPRKKDLVKQLQRMAKKAG